LWQNSPELKTTITKHSILEDKMKYLLSVFLVVTGTSILWLSAAVPQTEESQIEGNLYTNIRLGFSFLFPSGWDVQQADDGDINTVGDSTVVFKASDSDLTLFAFFANLPDPSATTPVVETGGEWLGIHEEDMEEQNFEVQCFMATSSSTVGTSAAASAGTGSIKLWWLPRSMARSLALG
jgi:hypothetical protein